jgi:hypothetical protein
MANQRTSTSWSSRSIRTIVASNRSRYGGRSVSSSVPRTQRRGTVPSVHGGSGTSSVSPRVGVGERDIVEKEITDLPHTDPRLRQQDDDRPFERMRRGSNETTDVLDRRQPSDAVGVRFLVRNTNRSAVSAVVTGPTDG